MTRLATVFSPALCLMAFRYLASYQSWHVEILSTKMPAYSYSWCDVMSTSVHQSSVQFISVAQSCPTLCDPLNRSTPGLPVHHQPLEFTHSCLSSQWCNPAISSSVVPFTSCPKSLLASESFPMSQLFAWGGQSTGVSGLASFLPNDLYTYLQFQPS